MNYPIRHISIWLWCLLLLVGSQNTLIAQSGSCDSNTPFYVVNLSTQINGSFISPQDRREGNCCNTIAPDRCVEFEVTLHPYALGISFDIYSGAVPSGSMYYQVNCGPPIAVGQPVCLSGAGPHTVTFCKPGNNPNAYIIRSIPPPYQAPDNEVRIGCSIELGTNGLIPNTISWRDITSTNGAYNSYLSCLTGCSTTYFTPGPGAPSYVDYEVCGSIFETVCNGYFNVCDTLRVFVYPELEVPDLDTIYYCITNGGITLQGSAYGGFGSYEYFWYDSAENVLGNGSSYFASTPGIYQLEIRDDLYPACPADLQNIHVLPDLPATVYAGLDTLICSSSPIVSLSGSFSNAPGVQWLGGNGTFQLPRDSIGNSYAPTATEINNLSVILTLTTTPDTACPVATDQKVIQFRTPPVLAITDAQDLTCFESGDGYINVSTTGGTAPYSFQWSNGTNTEDISSLDTGYYSLQVTDMLGCSDTIASSITQPTPLLASALVANVICSGNNNGSVQVSVSGGGPPYSYNWSNGANTATQNGLAAGSYQITISDANGCTLIVDTIITQPLAFVVAVANASNISCYGSNDGAIVLQVGGGTPNYTYQWSNGQNTPNVSGLVPGNYSVTVTDGQGCVQTANATITEPQPLQGGLTVTYVSCYGGANGAIDLDPRGGVAPYSYRWSNGASTQDINSIAAGLYEVTLTDANGCSLTNSRWILEPDELVVTSITNNVSCFGDANGSIDLTVSGGTGSYVYQWSNGAAGQDLNAITAGNYSVTVTDGRGCKQILSFNITQPAQIVLAYTASPASCNGGTNGAINLTATGGSGAYTYQWANGASAEDIANLSAGSYPVTVTDGSGCSVDTVALVVEPNQIVLQINPTAHVTCFGGSNGAISLLASGGSGSYSYLWSNGANTQGINNLSAGSYQVTVNDVNNCRSLASATIQQPQPLVAAAIHTDITCKDADDGAIDLQVSGGTSPYTFLWNDGAVMEDRTSLSEGNYAVTITDANGCTITAGDSIYNPDALVLQPYINHVSCYGGSNGFLEVNPTGGYAPYSFSWVQGGNMPFLFNLAAGSYEITVTDASNCEAVATYIVQQPDSIVLTGTTTNVACFGGSNGAIALNATGGTPNYTYNWSNGSTSGNINGIAAGSHHVTVSDANACTQTASFAITQPDSLRLQSAVTNIACYGNSTGAISVTVSGGTAPYSYQWLHGATTKDLTGLPAGTYTLQATDARGCQTAITRQVTQPQALALSLTKEDILCHGNNNGSISSMVTGGTQPYSYLWSNGAITSSIFSLGPGFYSVTVTDARGCTTTGQQTIAMPTALATASTTNNLSCYQSNDGGISVAVSGGTGPYGYQWLDGSTSPSLSNLSVGDYYLTITDANGCQTYYNTVLTQPTELLLNAVTQDASCNGIADGSIDLSVSGSVPGYTYLWSTNATSQDLNNIPAGIYDVTVTDAIGCSQSVIVPVSEPSNLQISTQTTQQVNCNGGNNGAIALTITGSTPISQISWSNGSNNQNISQLQAGDYFVTVTDINGCRKIDFATVTEPAPLSIVPTITDVTCFGLANGSVSVTVSGGTAPYQYQWSNGGNGTTNNNLAAGSYSLEVTDQSGCTTLLNYTIEGPDALVLSASTTANVSCFGGSDGAVQALISGGTAPYQIIWSNGSTALTNNSLPTGTYSVTATDANGCTTTRNTSVSQPDSMGLSLTPSHVTCNGGNDGSISLITAGGTTPYTYLWSNGDTTASIQNLSAAGYQVTVTDARGCAKITSVLITEPSAITHQLTVSNVNCYNGNDGSIAVSLSGGVSPYTINWSNGSSQSINMGLTVGAYTVSITDANGCLHVASTTVAQPDSMIMTVATTNVSCYGLHNGSATISIIGGTGSYTYNWSNGATTAAVSGLGAGNYTYQINDGANCVINGNINISQQDSLSAGTEGTPWICEGTATGQISLLPLGGVAPYSYNWSNGSSDSTNSNLPHGSYSATVTDGNGCLAAAQFTINEIINQLNLSATVACVNENIRFDGSTNADTAIVSWQWHFGDGNTSNAQNTSHAYGSAGTKTVTLIITSSTGCRDTLTSPVTIHGLPVVDAGAAQTICQGTNATLTATGGISYQWSPIATLSNPTSNTTQATPMQSQWYSVWVSDINGCANRDSVLVAVENIPIPGLSRDTAICPGDTIRLTANGGATYQWYGNMATMSCNTCAQPQVYPTQRETYIVKVSTNAGCEGWDTITVGVHASPGGITANLTSLCQQENVSLNGPLGIGYQYQWSPANLVTNPSSRVTHSLPLDSNAVFMLTTTDNFGCSFTDTLPITMLPVPHNFLPDTAEICLGDTVSISAPQSLINISWTGPVGTLSCDDCATTVVGPSINSLYTITATTTDGCPATDSAVVHVHLPSLPNLGDGLGFCSGMEIVIPATVYPNATYQWSPSTGLDDPTAAQPVATLNQNQTYFVTITDINGCVATDSMVYVLRDSLPLEVSGDTTVCEGQLVTLSVNTLYPMAGENSIVWYDVDGHTVGSGNTIEVEANTNFAFTAVIQSTGCQPDTARMSIHTTPTPSVTIEGMPFARENDSIQLAATGDSSYLYEWSTGTDSCVNCNVIVVEAIEGTPYSVTVTDEFGCKAETHTTVRTFCDAEIFIPNSFSPNKDAKNEVFRVRSMDDIEVTVFRIFDRWGNMVFEGGPNAPEWNGFYRNKPADPGVYVYYMEVKCPFGQTTFFKGNVTLLQ